jgi:hypothetical protein
MDFKLKSRNSRIDRINNIITSSKQIQRKSDFLKSKFSNFSKTLRTNNSNFYNPSTNIYKRKITSNRSQDVPESLIKKSTTPCPLISQKLNKINNVFSSIKSFELSKSKGKDKDEKKHKFSPMLKVSSKTCFSDRKMASTFLSSSKSILRNIEKKFEAKEQKKPEMKKIDENNINEINRGLLLSPIKNTINETMESNFGIEQKNKMLEFLNELKILLSYEDELKNKTDEIVMEIKKDNIFLEKKINIHACNFLNLFVKRKKKIYFQIFFKKIFQHFF